MAKITEQQSVEDETPRRIDGVDNLNGRIMRWDYVEIENNFALKARLEVAGNVLFDKVIHVFPSQFDLQDLLQSIVFSQERVSLSLFVPEFESLERGTIASLSASTTIPDHVA